MLKKDWNNLQDLKETSQAFFLIAFCGWPGNIHLILAGRAEIFINFAEHDARNILLSFNGEDADISLLLNGPLESGGIRIFSDMDCRDSVLDLSKKSNQRFQIGDFHIGNDEEIEIFSSMNQGDKILQIESSSPSKILTVQE